MEQTALPPSLSASHNVNATLHTQSPIVRVINRAIRAAGHLTSFLPTGTALVFQFLLPIVSNTGKCAAREDKLMTAGLMAACGLSCFILAFTDSYTAPDGKVYYGIATTRGLWIPQLPNGPSTSARYKLQPMDFVHALISVVVFAASSLFAPNVKSCFYPSMPSRLQESLPIVTGFVASFIFVVFPSKRRGFDEPPEPTDLN